MAAGDTVTANNATAASGTFTIQPAVGAEWVIHNIVTSGAAKLQSTDGTNVVVLATYGGGVWDIPSNGIHVTNTVYLQLVDTSGATNNMHYDGVQTK